MYRYLFGPVPSRRLGCSLGVDLVPSKTCSFDCVFCQVGKTNALTIERKEYVPVSGVIEELSSWLGTGAALDCITLAGSGEPTLHSGFGDIIEAIRGKSTVKTVILSNGSLFYLPEVRSAAVKADIVKVSLSAWDQDSFEKINRPFRGLKFQTVYEGLKAFGSEFQNELWLEVFVVAGINDDEPSMRRVSSLAREIGPDRIHINTVVRPPSENSARAVQYNVLERLVDLFQPVAEVIAPYSAGVESSTGGSEKNIAGLLARHPCKLAEIAMLFGNNIQKTEEVLNQMLANGAIRLEKHGNEIFYSAVDLRDSSSVSL